MTLQFVLDRGRIDSLGELRTTFKFSELRPGTWRGVVVNPSGGVAVVADRLWLTDQSLAAVPFLLGADREGMTYVAWLVESDLELPPGVRFRPLTEVGTRLSDDESILASQAVALGLWHARDRFCTRCGSRVRPIDAGWATQCEACGDVEYPRTDPVVIVRVTDGYDRVLLAHNAAWPKPTLSLPAGFVEAGETPRRAVEREVCEEVGVPVHNLKYLGSQPWPGPRSLMLAFRAHTVGKTVTPVPDQVEIDYAAFYTREDYLSGLRTQEIFAPRPSSIAAAVLTDWLGQPLYYPQN